MSFPGGSVVKNPPANCWRCKRLGFDPGSGKSLGEGNGNLLQYSCLGNPRDRGAWRATVHGAATEQDTTQRPDNNKRQGWQKEGAWRTSTTSSDNSSP